MPLVELFDIFRNARIGLATARKKVQADILIVIYISVSEISLKEIQYPGWRLRRWSNPVLTPPQVIKLYNWETNTNCQVNILKGWKAVFLFCQYILIWADQEGEVSCFNISWWGGKKKTCHLLKAVLNNVNYVWLIVSFYEEDLKTDVVLTVWFWSLKGKEWKSSPWGVSGGGWDESASLRLDINTCTGIELNMVTKSLEIWGGDRAYLLNLPNTSSCSWKRECRLWASSRQEKFLKNLNNIYVSI